MKGTFSFDFDQKSLNNFEAQCEAAIRNLGNGTKKATTAACQEILGNSMAEVPKAQFGEDAVAKVGSNEYGVIVGQVIDKDGFPQDVVVTVKPTVKEWESRKTAKREYEQYVLADAAEAYEIETKEKEEAKAKAKAEREAAKAAKE